MSIYQHPDVAAIIDLALSEDLGPTGDATVGIVSRRCTAQRNGDCKEAGVVVGMPLWDLVCEKVGGAVTTSEAVADGTAVQPGDVVLRFQGDAATILVAERTFLNLAQRLSGSASVAAIYAQAIAGTNAKVFDTRKTDPGLRLCKSTRAVRRCRQSSHRPLRPSAD